MGALRLFNLSWNGRRWVTKRGYDPGLIGLMDCGSDLILVCHGFFLLASLVGTDPPTLRLSDATLRLSRNSRRGRSRHDRRVWDCQPGLPPQTDPPATTPGLIGTLGSPSWPQLGRVWDGLGPFRSKRRVPALS